MRPGGNGEAGDEPAVRPTTGGTGMDVITVRFLGGSLVPGLPREVSVQATRALTADELLGRLEPLLGVTDLRVKLEQHFALLVNGTSIQHLGGWSTLIEPGASVSVVAPMGGGGPAE